ncbi:hypothetical protein BofuT4_uP140840.1 [Botrytis cinerea T4]|uniref:Uncharacterized protein n=1 Tax=Botryotinia fuckeliana (strain T4) TaxID=999810 RepID=G2YYX4_BOTF4|nr:hypothetical protein BofuT4_uP140840.1 [Botrytis cinerea T4]
MEGFLWTLCLSCAKAVPVPVQLLDLSGWDRVALGSGCAEGCPHICYTSESSSNFQLVL